MNSIGPFLWNALEHVRNAATAFMPYVAYLSLLIAFVALAVTLWDRRARFLVQTRKGKWITWHGEMLVGIVEVYNNSSRPNTITAYRISAKSSDGKWVELESERYEDADESDVVYNDTPVTLSAYSGTPVRFGAFGSWKDLPRDLHVRLQIVDLFGSA